MTDFTNCPVNRFRAYGGANGNKINITYQGHSYMLKFPPKPSRNWGYELQQRLYQRICRLSYL